MKKTLKLLSLILVLVIALTAFTGCDVINKIKDLIGGNKPAETIVVTWYDGAKQLKSQEIKKGGTVTSYIPPEKAGYTFQAWYADADFTKLFDFTAPINENTSIYAAYVDAGFVPDETSYYLIGDGRGDLSVSNWDHGASMGDDNLCLKNQNVPGANVFSTTITMFAGDRFQICHDGVWDGQVGIGAMEGAQLNEAGDHAYVVDDLGITVFEAPKNEYHADFRAWDVTLAEGQDGIYKITYTTYADPTKNVITWELVEKLDASDAPVKAVQLFFTGTFNDWTTAFEEGSEWMLYDNEDGTWEGTIVITTDMYGEWTFTEVGTYCAALKLYDKANDAWIGYNGDGNLLLKEGVYRIVYTVATNSYVCEILEGGEIVEGSGGSTGGGAGGQGTWYVRGTMNDWGTDSNYLLTADENGNYSITLQLNVGDTFKVATADWSQEFGYAFVEGNTNFKEAVEFGNIEVVVAGNYTITVTATGGLSILADGQSSEPVIPSEPEDITLYYYTTEWTAVNLYAWNASGEHAGTWPGTAMTAVEGKDGWYTLTINASVTALKVIFNDGTSQTADLSYAGLNYWVGETAYETIEAAEEAITNPPVDPDPTPDPELINWYFAGSMNGWAQADPLVYDENGVASIEMTLAVGDEFKIADNTNSDWLPQLNSSNIPTDLAANFGDKDSNILVNIAGTYKFSVVDGALVIEVIEVSEPSEPVIPTTVWYLKGTMNGWSDNDSYVLTYDENGVASLTVDLAAGDNFKIATSNWNPQFGYSDVQGNANFEEGTNDEGVKNGNIAVVVAGTYKFSVANGALVVELVEASEPSEPSDPVDPPVVDGITLYYYNNNWSKVNVYTFANNSTIGAAWPGTAMTAVEGKDGWYTITLNVSAEGLYVIFNNGSGDQTPDLVYEGLNYWVVDTAYETLEEAEDAASVPTATPSGWYVRGTMNGWGTGDALVLDENGTPSITIDLAAGATFKVAKADWSQEYKYSADLGANFKNGAENGNIEVVVAGTYTISIVSGKLVITPVVE